MNTESMIIENSPTLSFMQAQLNANLPKTAELGDMFEEAYRALKKEYLRFLANALKTASEANNVKAEESVVNPVTHRLKDEVIMDPYEAAINERLLDYATIR